MPSIRSILARGGRYGRSPGQVVVIFAMSIFLFVMLCAVVVDISWYWVNTLRVQRAADAAALAGVVQLPANVGPATLAGTAYNLAIAEAGKDGYPNGAGGVTVAPVQDAVNDRRLNVTVSAPVGTFFMRLIGISSITARRDASAEYVLPVPMGSPENYYGTFGAVRTSAGGSDVPNAPAWTDTTNPYALVTTTKGTNAWTNPTNAYTSDNLYATSNTNNQAQAWGYASNTTLYNLIPSGATINGIEVDVEAKQSASSTNCTLNVDLSWNNGTNYTTGAGTGDKTVALTTVDPGTPGIVLGGPTDTWGTANSWVPSEFASGQFQVRLTNLLGAGCTATAQVDAIQVRVNYTTTTFVPDPNIFGPGAACPGSGCYYSGDSISNHGTGATLTARGFWGTELTQGAESISGDAYLPYYDVAGGATNPLYNATQYYNYAIDMPANSTNGSVYIFDPGFCEGTLQTGLGDTWVSGTNPVSAFFDLYADVNHTPYDLTDDSLVWSSNTAGLFKNSTGSDPALGSTDGSGLAGCDAYHLHWFRIPATLSGGAGGLTYRLHTYTTDPSSATAQRSTNARNGWALFASAAGGSPQVYGIGAMEMYTPLPGGQSSAFYLAKIDAVHAGKTMEISLFDPGDTNQNANIQILVPTSSGWSATQFAWTSRVGTTNSGHSSCNHPTPTTATSLVTYSSTGGGSQFNGCWVTIDIPIPTTYSAPQSGWWKIQYNMTGSSGTVATDITTWQVAIRGNPVHLILP